MSCPTGHTLYHAIPYQTITYTMLHLARPIHIPCDAHQAIQYTMPCPPDHTIYHVMPARPYRIPCHARQAIAYTCHPARPHHIPSNTSSTNTIYHAMPDKPDLISCHALKAIQYTMPYPANHTNYRVMPARPYYIPCHVGSRPSITSLKAETIRVRKVSLPGARLLFQLSRKMIAFCENYYLLFIRGQ